jgi:hypothetical protein
VPAFVTRMDDVLILVSQYLLSDPSAADSLSAFVKLQATHRGVWLRYKHDAVLWRSLGARLPKWSLPPHMGLRRRVITGIKLLTLRCVACGGAASRVFMAFQARLCGRCCHRVLISDFELAWGHGLVHASPPYIVRYIGHTRVLFFMRQHLRRLERTTLTRAQAFAFMHKWPGVTLQHIRMLVDRMG